MARGSILSRLVAFAAVTVLAQTACDWPWQHDMADQPSRPASAGPRSPAAGAVATGGSLPIRPEVAERQLRADIAARSAVEAGSKLYAAYCAPCHGPHGRGDGPVAREFAPPMGDLTGDLTAPDVQRHADGWFYAVITNGTEHMPRSAHELDPSERWQIVRFVRTLGTYRQ
ncbi:MAG: hypothetical protein DMG04_16875 [Acidobacteria bacterium]|nr:MAG: hypothetical protein DMG04_16875 [Acidobacteriota bacterium]PYQ84435.1 MAG: hypothetical protein DMG03_10960 [Acidobacteriota bacterium]PYQ91200.1 MAG: hypothetical protein DMG02_06550 [Acidobacteriota bacterium]PYR08356.1 MAG: hypothetical protein DMF99_19550 [Acidobacteriota bacterium]